MLCKQELIIKKMRKAFSIRGKPTKKTKNIFKLPFIEVPNAASELDKYLKRRISRGRFEDFNQTSGCDNICFQLYK